MGPMAVLTRWRDNVSAAGCKAVLACRHDDESAARRLAVLASWCDDKSVAGRTTLLARWRYDESAAGRTTVLALWRADSWRQGGRLKEHPQHATIDATINSVWNSGSRTACCRPRECWRRACWHDDESAARRMAVLARLRNEESAAGRTTVLAHWRDEESAVRQTMVLARLCDDGVDGRADDAGRPLLTGATQVGDGANGGARSLARQCVSGGA